jgi:hypothetical protein
MSILRKKNAKNHEPLLRQDLPPENRQRPASGRSDAAPVRAK